MEHLNVEKEANGGYKKNHNLPEKQYLFTEIVLPDLLGFIVTFYYMSLNVLDTHLNHELFMSV